MNTPRALSTVLAVFISIAPLSASTGPAASNPQEVEKFLATANQGKPPVLWFGSDPKVNLGSGSAAWTAQSGGQLAARGPDAWGRPAAAYGLAADAKGGVAISGSTTASLINAKSGSVLLFFRPAEKAAPPMMLFSRADWGNPNYLCLRINAVGSHWELTLAAADLRSKDKAIQANFATLTPGAWTFVAVTWQESGALCRFRYWAGDLATGELTEGELETPPLDPSPGIFVLAGRRADNVAKYATAPLLFSDGLLQHLSVYDAALSEDIVKRIYLAATRR